MRMLCSVVSITGIILYHRNCRRHSKHAKSYPRVTPSFSPSRCKHFEILTHARARCTARFAFARALVHASHFSTDINRCTVRLRSNARAFAV